MAKVTPALVTKDRNGIPTWGLEFVDPDFNWMTTLALNIQQTLLVPPLPNATYNSWQAFFQVPPGGTIIAGLSAVTLPGGSFAKTAGQINPGCRTVLPGQTIYVITPNAGGTIVNISFYAR